MDGLTGKVLAKKYDPEVQADLAQPAAAKGGDFFQPNPKGVTLPDKTAIKKFAVPKADKRNTFLHPARPGRTE